MKEVRKGREWAISLEGGPVRIILDRRLKPKAYKSTGEGLKLFDPGMHSYPEEREIRTPNLELLKKSLGHELGHIEMGHEGILDKEEKITPQWIREEIEAEEWSYSQGFPHRKGKIENLRNLALEIGMTKKQFNKMHRGVKKEV